MDGDRLGLSHLRGALRRADLRQHRTLEQFDFRNHPELRKLVYRIYLDPAFVREGRSLILIGPAGLGKTHLAEAIAVHIAQTGFDVRWARVQWLMSRVQRCDGTRDRKRFLTPYRRCDLLVLDDLGCHVPGTGSEFYELIADRCEKRATIITSNLSLTEWDRPFEDSALASMIVERLVRCGDISCLTTHPCRRTSKGTERDEGGQSATTD